MNEYVLGYLVGLIIIGWPMAALSLYLVSLGDALVGKIGLRYLRDSLHPFAFVVSQRVKTNDLWSYRGLIPLFFSRTGDLRDPRKRLQYVVLSSLFWPARCLVWFCGLSWAVINANEGLLGLD